MLKIIVPTEIEQVKKQIKALEYQIKRDIREKDKQIHREALEVLRLSLDRGKLKL